MITKEDYNEWGQKLFEKAKVIYEIEVEHRFKIIEIIKILKTKYNLIDDDLFEYLSFRSKTMKGSLPGPEEVKLYWLNYIVEYFSMKYNNFCINTNGKDTSINSSVGVVPNHIATKNGK